MTNRIQSKQLAVPTSFLGIILIWTTTPLTIKWSSEGPGFLFALSARMLLGLGIAALALAVMRQRLPWHRRARLAYLAAALGIYGAMTCVYWGAQYIPSGLIAVVFGLTPIITSVFAALWNGDRTLTPFKLAGMVLGLVGLGTIFMSDIVVDTDAWLGIVAVVLSVSFHSASAVWVRRLGTDVSPLAINVGGLTIAVLLFLITWIGLGDWPQQIPTRAAWSIVYLAVFGTGLGFALYFFVLSRIDAANVSLITLVTPVTALWLGRAFNHEIIDPTVWLGTALILSGLGLHQWADSWFRSDKAHRDAT